MNNNNSFYKNSEICQKCANCCKQWGLYFHSKDDITRISWLDTERFIIVKVRDNLWKVIFDFPCKQLIEKDGKYYCKEYDSPIRPMFCKTYPLNFKNSEKAVIDCESKMCPIIKENKYNKLEE